MSCACVVARWNTLMCLPFISRKITSPLSSRYDPYLAFRPLKVFSRPCSPRPNTSVHLLKSSPRPNWNREQNGCTVWWSNAVLEFRQYKLLDLNLLGPYLSPCDRIFRPRWFVGNWDYKKPMILCAPSTSSSSEQSMKHSTQREHVKDLLIL